MESQSLSSTAEPLNPGPPAQSSPAIPAAARTVRGNTGRTASIGKSLVLTGTLAGQEDVFIDGTMEGTIELPDSDLTIGPNGNVKANVKARKITVFGRVTGKMFPAERIEILKTATVRGTIKTPRIVVEEGAVIHGKIESLGQDMNFPGAKQTKPLIIRQERRG
ncbi:MAG: polymer-forming cytoskeletal protein [Acidobacteriota bacterium]|nr:polymer-forming cytoskeletal protein [Acidobacteriota bacterium]MDE2964635.1 polymer-forming cytoskeletal protein [Acidobacteriota bacterium]